MIQSKHLKALLAIVSDDYTIHIFTKGVGEQTIDTIRFDHSQKEMALYFSDEHNESILRLDLDRKRQNESPL